MMKNEKRPIGRPSKYSPELAAYICNQIASGISLRQICADKRPKMDDSENATEKVQVIRV